MKRALVTGGAGFIGSNLVSELVKRDYDVTIVDNLSTGDKKNLKGLNKNIKFYQASCDEITNLDLEKPDVIYHIGIPSSSPMYRNTPLLTGNAINEFVKIMELSKTYNSKVIYASSSSMYGRCEPPHTENMEIEPFDYYTEARLTMERIAKVYHELHDVKSIGLRLFSIYGPNEKSKGKYANIVTQFLWKMMKDKSPVIYGDGKQTRDFTHVSDVVKAFIKAGETNLDYEIINVGTGTETSFKKVVNILNQKLGKSLNPEYVENPIENYVERTLADISKAETLLEYSPEIELERGIERKIEMEKRN